MSFECFHEPTEVIQIDNVIYYASSSENVCSFTGEVVLNLSRDFNINSFSDDERFDKLKKLVYYPFKEVKIFWPFAGNPYVLNDFWVEFHKTAVESKIKRICVCCDNVHGRTGTALSALLIANSGISAVGAVEIIRDTLCEMCIESATQSEYLYSLDKCFNQNVDEKYPEPYYCY